MIIKKFVAKTEEDAVDNAKKELGSGVVVMNVKQVKATGLFWFLKAKQTEVTVALEEEGETIKKVEKASTIIRPAEAPKQKEVEHSTEGKTNAIENDSAKQIEQKLDNLQSLLESQMKNSFQAKAENQEDNKKIEADENEDSKQEDALDEQDKFIRLLYNTMIDNEVDEKFANQMMEDIEKNKKPNMAMDYLLANLYQKMILKFGKSDGIVPSENKPKVVIFLGPTGVGKTTTIAKLAGEFTVNQKKKIALFTTDTYRIAATDQLRTYADILEVPLRVLYTAEEFENALAGFTDYDYIFVDTAGHSHQAEDQMEDMRSFVRAISGLATIQSFLVLSATTKYRDLLRIAENYKTVTDYQLIFTKIDETDTLGNLFNVKMAMNTPIAYVTYGQNVPNDIELFDPQKTVKRLLGGKRL